MSLATGVAALATRVATEFNTLRGQITTLLAGKANTSHAHAGTDITSSTVPYARMPVGTSNVSVAIGNHTHDVAYQPLDSDLTAIAGLGVTNDSFIQGKSGAWAKRTVAQVKTDLAYTKSDVSLGSVDNTADTAKPVSTAQATAIAARGGNIVGRNRRTDNETGPTSAAAFAVISTIAPVLSGRMYRVTVMTEVGDSVNGGISQSELRYTTNNTEPTSTSTLLSRALVQHVNGDIPDSVSFDGLFICTANGTFRVGLFGTQAAGAGALTYYANPVTDLFVTDAGPTVSESGTDA